jgi:predicted Zn-dependent protease with MMP-like domain
MASRPSASLQPASSVSACIAPASVFPPLPPLPLDGEHRLGVCGVRIKSVVLDRRRRRGPVRAAMWRSERMTKRLAERPPSIDDLEQIARAQLVTIPELFRRHFRDVVIRVEEFCDEEVEAEMGLESPFDLLGLYRGVSLDRKSVSASASDLDMIFLYRRPILDYWCETGEDLARIVRHVLVHEVGHHFGLSDEDMHRIENSS